MRYGVGMFVAVVLAFAAMPGRAESERWPPIPDPDEIIKHCWDISAEMRASDNASQREGALDTALCLRNAIKEHMAILVGNSRLETAGSMDEILELIHAGLGKFYWEMYNNNDACDQGCGSAWFAQHNFRTARFYEEILRDVLNQRDLRETPDWPNRRQVTQTPK